MKRIILALSAIILLSCQKDSGTKTSNEEISYEVNITGTTLLGVSYSDENGVATTLTLKDSTHWKINFINQQPLPCVLRISGIGKATLANPTSIVCNIYVNKSLVKSASGSYNQTCIYNLLKQ